MKPVLTPQAALIYVMVIQSASDADMSDAELHLIGEIVKTLPVFAPFDPSALIAVARECAAILGEPQGLEQALILVAEALPHHLRETAYVIALDVAMTKGPVQIEEMRILDRLRHALELDRLVAAAIERSAIARFASA
ncbi:MAG: tellurite resistance TerB family protein [Alphaproteobacteria bacterium]|nr:tellurite resistance TerB family protein [Alphaproteobacteria bacterium]